MQKATEGGGGGILIHCIVTALLQYDKPSVYCSKASYVGRPLRTLWPILLQRLATQHTLDGRKTGT
jgi:hypothetical protein